MDTDNEFKPRKSRKKEPEVEETPIVKVEEVVTEPEKIIGSRVFIPSYCTAIGREKPSGESNYVITLHNEDELWIDGFRNNGMWTWYHDTRGFWIESKQVVCLIDVKEI